MSDENGNPFNLPSFRKELSDLLDEKLEPITHLVNSHEAQINRAHGAMWAFGFLWAIVLAAVTGLVEWLFHAGKH